MDPRIIVPLDGTQASEAVLRYVPVLARALPAEIVLFRSVTLATAPLGSFLAVPAVSEEKERASLIPLRDRLARAGFPCRIEVCAGPAAPSIVAAASLPATKFVALSTHEGRGLRRLLPGRISLGVIQHSPAPVFVVKSELTASSVSPAFRSILVPLDPRPGSNSLLGLVCALAQRWGARVVFLHPDPSGIPRAPDSRERPSSGHIDPPVLAAAARESAIRGIRATFVVGSGAHARGILSASRECSADLIALRPRLGSGLPRLLQGHVIGGFLRRTDIPLLFLP